MTDTGLYIGGQLQTVDRKGRVAIPSLFRSAIERNSAERIILISYHSKRNCLRGFDSRWAADAEADFRRRLLAEGADAEAIEEEREAIFGEVEHAPFDPSGRFNLDPFAREEMKITDRAFFQGIGPSFYIWAPEMLYADANVSDRVKRKCASQMAGKGGGE